jgi:hypothetical protein
VARSADEGRFQNEGTLRALALRGLITINEQGARFHLDPQITDAGRAALEHAK